MNTPAINSITISPRQSRWESVLLFSAVILLIATAGLYSLFFGRVEKTQELLDWQVSAFSELQAVDQSIYSELLVASDEIYWLQYLYGPWPTDEIFQDNLLPPFYRDLSWEQKGEVKWVMKDVVQEGEAQGLTLYHGSAGNIDGQGAWLLVIGHTHAGNSQVNAASIFWHPDKTAPLPAHSKITTLVLEGWKQVVPYQGRDEVERLNAG